MNTMTETTIVGKLDLADAIGTMQACVENASMEGSIGDYLYARKNGKQILIGRPGFDAAVEGATVTMTQFVLVSKENGQLLRRPTTWLDLRTLVADGWVVGTDKIPGVKSWYPLTGRAIRRHMQAIYVFRK